MSLFRWLVMVVSLLYCAGTDHRLLSYNSTRILSANDDGKGKIDSKGPLMDVRNAVVEAIKRGEMKKCHYFPVQAHDEYSGHKWDRVVKSSPAYPKLKATPLVYSPCMSSYNLGNSLGNYFNEIACAISANISIIIGTKMWDYPTMPFEYKGKPMHGASNANRKSGLGPHELTKQHFAFFEALPLVFSGSKYLAQQQHHSDRVAKHSEGKASRRRMLATEQGTLAHVRGTGQHTGSGTLSNRQQQHQHQHQHQHSQKRAAVPKQRLSEPVAALSDNKIDSLSNTDATKTDADATVTTSSAAVDVKVSISNGATDRKASSVPPAKELGTVTVGAAADAKIPADEGSARKGDGEVVKSKDDTGAGSNTDNTDSSRTKNGDKKPAIKTKVMMASTTTTTTTTTMKKKMKAKSDPMANPSDVDGTSTSDGNDAQSGVAASNTDKDTQSGTPSNGESKAMETKTSNSFSVRETSLSSSDKQTAAEHKLTTKTVSTKATATTATIASNTNAADVSTNTRPKGVSASKSVAIVPQKVKVEDFKSACSCEKYCWSQQNAAWIKQHAAIRQLMNVAIDAHLAAAETQAEKGTQLQLNTTGGTDLSSAPADTFLPLIPDVAIQYRCGDTVPSTVYGFLPFTAFEKLIPADAKHIYVMTEPPARVDIMFGPGKHKFSTNCRPMMKDLFEYLKLKFPLAVVVVKSGGDPFVDVARLARARVTICAASTFCLWPAIASTGKAYFPLTSLVAGWSPSKDATPFLGSNFNWLRDPRIITEFKENTPLEKVLGVLRGTVPRTSV